ncbi:FDLD family class I lanthipeptide [Tumebacillus flagellatus]|nr:FDLD family class I lanthipeptide [Tumebacillus flagellatus]
MEQMFDLDVQVSLSQAAGAREMVEPVSCNPCPVLPY